MRLPPIVPGIAIAVPEPGHVLFYGSYRTTLRNARNEIERRLKRKGGGSTMLLGERKIPTKKPKPCVPANLCHCKKGCNTRRCPCMKANNPCVAKCHKGGGCDNKAE